AFFLSRRMINRIAEADEQKEIMNEQVIEAGRLASIGELAAGIAHEINNPVAIMVEEAGWIEDLLGDKDPDSDENMTEIQRAVMQIKTQGSRCKAITHKLLSFARNTDPQITEVNLNLVVKEIIGLMQQRTRYANVQIETYPAPGLPNVAASPSELQQVLLNLVNNAVDAMEPEGGTVSITTRVDNGDVFIDVADSGHGIPEANLIRIFDPFFTTKPVGQGTGLGLSICHGIINKIGGEITVRSEMGVGTVFIIRLPAVSDKDQSPRGPKSSAESTAAQPDKNNSEEENE
ncbi:MAG: ATP-binding protein, partial [Thermodesulfobacteriota bacterium]|nr:ATP-binding protein [Thermodesulfobacteriota bacterium]